MVPAVWRRLLMFEQVIVPSTKFTVHQPMSPFAAMSGALLSPGWSPSDALKNEPPPSDEVVQRGFWLQP